MDLKPASSEIQDFQEDSQKSPTCSMQGLAAPSPAGSAANLLHHDL
jgi:hypothetical protein